MSHQRLQIITPALGSMPHSEAEIFGSVVWLDMQSHSHRGMSLSELHALVQPIALPQEAQP